MGNINAKFDTDYTDLKKSESTNILTIEVREHLINNYQNHIKIFTDGSVLDSLDSEAGFVISELKVFLRREVFLLLDIHIWIMGNINGIKLHICNFVFNFFKSVLTQNQFYMHWKTGTVTWEGTYFMK